MRIQTSNIMQKLLMMKAAEDLKQQQLMKEQERQRILAERIIALPDVDNINDQGNLSRVRTPVIDASFSRRQAYTDCEGDVGSAGEG